MTNLADIATSPSRAFRRRPEVLAPAGNMEMMKAAVENGADAVYFGLQQFNARLRAANFDIADLPEIMAWLHERGVRGYVTMNTLIFVSEMEEAAKTLAACSDAGVDAVLIQDLGLARLANRLAPGMQMHASTQMTLTAAESVLGAEALGLKLSRVVAARELSRRELERMSHGTTHEIEVFVHGAICVAYSGQCLTSEALGGRSANRGECAQACRLPYDLMVDGAAREMEDVKYLLSPKDLAAFEDIGDLARIGIVSLKIEGRLKSPEYVAATVQSYRAAIDAALAEEEGYARPELDEPTRRKLEMTFSRGFTGGYLHATDHQAVVEGRFPKKRGLYLGRVVSVTKSGIAVHLEGPLKPGDGVVFDAGKPGDDEAGGRVFQLLRSGKSVDGFDPLDNGGEPADCTLTFMDGALDPRKVHAGDRVWKTSDPAMDAALRASFAGDQIRFRRPIRAEVWGAAGAPLRVAFTDWDGIRAEAEDTAPADAARTRPLTRETLWEQLGRLGNTPFELAGLDVCIDGDIMVPFSRLNDLRRRVAEELVAKRREIGRGRKVDMAALGVLRDRSRGVPPLQPARASVLVQQGAKLPHWTHPAATYAVCFRLADSIPTEVEQRLRSQRDGLRLGQADNPSGMSEDERLRLAELQSEAMEALLNLGHGSCLLREDECARIVADAMKHFDGTRYRLLAWCVMPNHVHAVLRTLGHPLAEILHTWKSFTEKKLNKRLGRTGTLWLDESYDRIVRSRTELQRQFEYVRRNPEVAGLRSWKWVGGVELESAFAAFDESDPSTGVLPIHMVSDEHCIVPLQSGKSSADYGEVGSTRQGRDAPATVPGQATLSVLCRTLDQVRASVAHGGIECIYTDFEDIRLHKEARELIPRDGPRFVPATIRVVKPGEAAFVRVLLKSEPDAVLVRGLAAWHVLRSEAPGLPLVADYALNIANDLTARLLAEHGMLRQVPSYDLNIAQLLDLLRAAPEIEWEATLHQYMPMFHMEHCVFCRFLSDGTDFTNCGRPCESHAIALRDRMGYEHPVKADAGCRNTVFNAVAQSASAYLSQLQEAGVRRYRIDFLLESEDAVREAIGAYLPAIRGEADGQSVWRRLKATSKLGVTRGPLDAG